MTKTPTGKPAGDPSSVAGVRKALVGDLAGLIAEIPPGRALSPSEVHGCRKRVKRMRALLALLRPALDDRTFRECDGDLRQAGKTLSRTRNVAVLAQTEQELLDAPARPRGARGGGHSSGRHSRAAVASASQTSQTRKRLASALRRLQVAGLRARGWSPLGDGLRRVYRRGRRAMPVATQPSSEQLHAWRRHVKRYWHLLETFEPVNPRRLRPCVRQARILSDVLGREHDLSLLEAKLKRREDRRSPTDARTLAKISQRRTKLARKALAIGRRLYAAKPRQIEADLRRDWERWMARRRA